MLIGIGVNDCRAFRLAIATWGICSFQVALGLHTPSPSPPPAPVVTSLLGGASTGDTDGWASVIPTPQATTKASGGANTGHIVEHDGLSTLGEHAGHRRLSTSSDSTSEKTPAPSTDPLTPGPTPRATVGSIPALTIPPTPGDTTDPTPGISSSDLRRR
ncbi:unnamed protein product [Ectocarpus sp. 12 AP-2014]